MRVRGLRLLRSLPIRALDYWSRRPFDEVWIDVGAHLGETTFRGALSHPRRIVYAFEPNLGLAASMMGRVRNFVVLPIAISTLDGAADFHLNAYDSSSSLLPLDQEGVKLWKSFQGAKLAEVETQIVPTMRLDTFLARANLPRVNFLKIDAQGSELDVIRSAGDRLYDIDQIKTEVTVVDAPVYQGQARKEDVVEYLTSHGFRLHGEEDQTYGQEQNLTFVRDSVPETAQV